MQQASEGGGLNETPTTGENTMMKHLVAATLLSFAVGFGPAAAQNPPAASTPAPSATPSPSTPMSATDKQAISKSCTDQANAKGLHGKARKKFRSDCKHKGGKM
jgi:hypothetical protein